MEENWKLPNKNEEIKKCIQKDKCPYIYPDEKFCNVKVQINTIFCDNHRYLNNRIYELVKDDIK